MCDWVDDNHTMGLLQLYTIRCHMKRSLAATGPQRQRDEVRGGGGEPCLKSRGANVNIKTETLLTFFYSKIPFLLLLFWLQIIFQTYTFKYWLWSHKVSSFCLILHFGCDEIECTSPLRGSGSTFTPSFTLLASSLLQISNDYSQDKLVMS